MPLGILSSGSEDTVGKCFTNVCNSMASQNSGLSPKNYSEEVTRSEGNSLLRGGFIAWYPLRTNWLQWEKWPDYTGQWLWLCLLARLPHHEKQLHAATNIDFKMAAHSVAARNSIEGHEAYGSDVQCAAKDPGKHARTHTHARTAQHCIVCWR